MVRELTCIACPLGCSLSVELEGKKILSVKGNTCKRGEVYATNECISPMRTVTTTVRSENGDPVAVKTKNPIPKEKVFDAMKIINKTVIKTPIKVGDVIIDDLFGSPLVATQDKE